MTASSTGFLRMPFLSLILMETTFADMFYDTTEKEENTNRQISAISRSPENGNIVMIAFDEK
jgi:hypothetical protein